MNLTQSFFRILPEVILTLTGVIVMMIEATLPRHASRKPLGWLAILGTLAALFASLHSCRSLPEPPTAAWSRPMPSASSSMS